MKIRTNQFINRKKGDFEKIKLDALLMEKIVEDMRLYAKELMPLNHWHLVEKEKDTDDLAVPDSSIADQYDRSMKEQYYNAETMLDAWIGCIGMQGLTQEDICHQEEFLQKMDSLGMFEKIKEQGQEAFDYRKQDLTSVAEVNLLYAGMLQSTDIHKLQGEEQTAGSVQKLCRKETVFLEVGGGYGRIAEAVMNVFSGVKYVMIDAVPGSLLYAYEYLKYILTDQRVGFFYKGDKFDLDQFDVYILPSWHFEACNRYQYSCCINISSMQEMGQGHVDYYLGLFDRVLKPGGIVYVRNSRDYVFKGEWHFNKCWKRLFMYNIPSSWTDYYPSEIFRKEDTDCTIWNQCVLAGYEYALYEKQQLKKNAGQEKHLPKEGQFPDLMTIALIGRYSGKQLSYALNTVFGQDVLNVELIISVCGEDTLMDTAAATLDAHDVPNIKRISMDQRTGELGQKERLKYLLRHMTGNRFLILADGACFYQNESLHKCTNNFGSDQFLLGACAVYDEDDHYLGDIRQEMYESPEEFLHQTLQHHGGVIMPGRFAESDEFYTWIVKGGALEDAICRYLSKHTECSICVSGSTLLKCYQGHTHAEA